MKKLIIMLLTFTTMAYADDSRYTMVNSDGDGTLLDYVWILDAEKSKLKYCWRYPSSESGIYCSKWKDIED